MMSAPLSRITSCGDTPVPRDFDIFSPDSLTMNPHVTTCLYGAAPSIPAPISSDDWNQPRCWSCPSRYTAAGHVSSERVFKTAMCEHPESNHTSRMSVSFRNVLHPHAHANPVVRKSLIGCSNHASAPSRRKISTTRLKHSGDVTGSAHFSQ